MRWLGSHLDITSSAPEGVVWLCTVGFPVPRAVSILGVRWPASSVVVCQVVFQRQAGLHGVGEVQSLNSRGESIRTGGCLQRQEVVGMSGV